MRIILIVTVLILINISGVGAAGPLEIKTADESAAAPAATIDDIAWLSGRWLGEGLGGVTEEVMAPAAGGQMMGMFRHLDRDGVLKFYEFYVFIETGNTLVLRIKHFTPAFTGWEEKDEYREFPLVAIEENAAYFDGLTYALTGPDTLEAAVRIDDHGVEHFVFSRQE